MLRSTVRDAAAAPAWKTLYFHVSRPRYGAVPGAGIGSWRYNAALRYARDTKLYPYCLEVFVPFAKTGRHGRPNAAETQWPADVEAEIEEKVIAGVGDRAVLAGVLTDQGDHRFFFYTDFPVLTAKLRGQLRAATGIGTLRVYCEPDIQWFTYKFRTSMAREPLSVRWTLRFVVLCAAGPASYGAVQSAYHGVWGLGELLVLGILVGARLLTRYSSRQPPVRPALAFGGYATALSAIIFPLLALVRVPALTGLVISLLAGPALAAAARKWQFRRWPRKLWILITSAREPTKQADADPAASPKGAAGPG